VQHPAKAQLKDPEARADVIGMAAPFSNWPRAQVLRLAAAASVGSHRSGTLLIATREQQFVFDAPLVRAASLLLGMLAKNGRHSQTGPQIIDLRLSQGRLAELLGTSRQWATALVRELSKAGLVEWRYGRATVLDVQALRTLAASGIEAMG